VSYIGLPVTGASLPSRWVVKPHFIGDPSAPTASTDILMPFALPSGSTTTVALFGAGPGL